MFLLMYAYIIKIVWFWELSIYKFIVHADTFTTSACLLTDEGIIHVDIKFWDLKVFCQIQTVLPKQF